MQIEYVIFFNDTATTEIYPLSLHDALPISRVPPEHPLGTPEVVMAPVRQNFEQIRPLLKDKADLLQLDALQAWAESSYERLKPLLERRKAEGFIRECHGDIHLGNAAQID